MPKRPDLQLDYYSIRVKGHLDPCWAEWFEGLTIMHETDGSTTLVGPVVDQSALHGLLAKIRDLGLPLLSVEQLSPGEAAGDSKSNKER